MLVISLWYITLINKSEHIDFKIEEKIVFQYLINLFNRNEKIQIYNYNDSNYAYQKTIEDNLKKQIINIINKKPFVKVSDSSGEKIYFIKQKYLDFKFKLSQYNEFKNYLEVELWYGSLHNDIEIKLEEQISSDNIIDALIHKITLENDGNLIFINPKISEQYWLQTINEAIKNFTTKPKITINNSIINIQANDINIISFKINDVVNNKLSLMIRFKEIKKYFHFKTKYYWDHKTNKNFIISKLKNIDININTPKRWDNTVITLIKDEMIEITNPEIINHNGFKIDLNLDKYINIILKEPFTIHNSKKTFNIAIKYLNEEIINTKISFNGNVSEVNQELLKNIKETLENNISFDLAEINFSNSNNEILKLKEIINKTLNEQVTKNSLNPIFPHKIINNTTIINYWLKNEYQIDNSITEFIIKIKENHSQQDTKASIPLITTSNNNLEVKWNNIFQDNFIALNEMNPTNKTYFIKASAFRELYYENYYLRSEIELHNILARFKNYWYIKAIWQEILETFNKKVIYENKKIIFANQFQNSSSIQVYFQYFKDITKAEIINVMKNNSLAKILHLQDETELQNIEMLRDTLYSYIGKTINVQRELINISKLRLKFIKIEQNPHNPNFWTAYFNYFNNADLIPLQIYIFKPQKQHPELPTSITNNKRQQFIIKVIEWFKTVFNVTISIATLLSLLALGTIGNGLGIGGSLSLLQAGTSLISTVQTNTLDMFNISRENTFNTELTELEYDVSDELTSLLPSRNETTNFIETTIKEPQAPFNFLENTANQWKTISRMKQDSQPLNFSKILASWDNYQEEIFRFITNIYPSNINHNMDYLRWGRFDKYRIGKIKYTFSNFEFNIPLENIRFTNPSSELITAFKEKVKDIFQGVKFRLNEVQNCKNNSNLMSLLIPYLLIGNSGVMIQNEKHYFSTDSFWISNYEIINNEKITVYLEHILFNEPLMVSFNLF